jgi:hypothetical protein
MRVLLSLDLSTSSTGWAKFDLDTKALLDYGHLVPSVKSSKKNPLEYPRLQVARLKEMVSLILKLVDDSVEYIAVEEINRGISRLGQKTLDGLHFLLLSEMDDKTLLKVHYFDSDGRTGWRSANGLGLLLSAADRSVNKDRQLLNKKLKKGQRKLPMINQKTLACNYVNKQFHLSLNCEFEESDSDKADAIGLGWFTLTKVLTDDRNVA